MTEAGLRMTADANNTYAYTTKNQIISKTDIPFRRGKRQKNTEQNEAWRTMEYCVCKNVVHHVHYIQFMPGELKL